MFTEHHTSWIMLSYIIFFFYIYTSWKSRSDNHSDLISPESSDLTFHHRSPIRRSFIQQLDQILFYPQAQIIHYWLIYGNDINNDICVESGEDIGVETTGVFPANFWSKTFSNAGSITEHVSLETVTTGDSGGYVDPVTIGVTTHEVMWTQRFHWWVSKDLWFLFVFLIMFFLFFSGYYCFLSNEIGVKNCWVCWFNFSFLVFFSRTWLLVGERLKIKWKRYSVDRL